MALDPRSRERLEALGRSLPKPLPAPEAPRQGPRAAEAPRHAVETEENPEQLFRELMTASADGSVPPHLMDRLRQLEKQRRDRRPAAAPQASAETAPAALGGNGPAAPRRVGAARQKPGRSRPSAAPGSEESELYTAFAQLLLEDEELD